jgi:hypothetical protein
MAIDLKNLIDQVLEMARESLDLRKRNAEASWYGGNKDEEEYWKEMRRRNTELELRRAEGKNRLAEREMINTGDLEKQRVADAGELARKQLDLDFDKYKLGRDIDVDIYKTETDRYLKQQELAGKGDNKAKEIEAITGALSLTDLPEQTRKALTGRLNSIYSETPAPEGGKAETPQALPTPAAPKNEPDGIIGEILTPAPNRPAAPNVARQTLGDTITQPPKKKRFEDMTPDELRAEDEAWISKNKSATGNIPFWAGSKPSEAAAWNRKLISEGKKREDLFNRQ